MISAKVKQFKMGVRSICILHRGLSIQGEGWLPAGPPMLMKQIYSALISLLSLDHETFLLFSFRKIYLTCFLK